jgi:hypothetical protein
MPPNKKTRKQFREIESAVARAEGRQTLARFGHTGEDKFKEERQEHAWLHNIGKKNLQTLINKHYYKYDSKRIAFPSKKQTNRMYPKPKTRKHRR